MENNREFKGVWIPKEVWFDTQLNMLEKGILTEIDSLDNEETGCFASNKYLADFCQCSETKISTAISKLIKLGYLYIKSFDGRTRILKSRLSNFERQTLKNLKDNNINNNLKERKENIIKEKKEKTKQIIVNYEDVKAYAKSRGREDLARKFYDYYTADTEKPWHDSNGKSVKNWKQKFIMWQNHDPLAFQLNKVGAGIEGKQDDTVYHGKAYTKEELDSLIVDIDDIEI